MSSSRRGSEPDIRQPAPERRPPALPPALQEAIRPLVSARDLERVMQRFSNLLANGGGALLHQAMEMHRQQSPELLRLLVDTARLESAPTRPGFFRRNWDILTEAFPRVLTNSLTAGATLTAVTAGADAMGWDTIGSVTRGAGESNVRRTIQHRTQRADGSYADDVPANERLTLEQAEQLTKAIYPESNRLQAYGERLVLITGVSGVLGTVMSLITGNSSGQMEQKYAMRERIFALMGPPQRNAQVTPRAADEAVTVAAPQGIPRMPFGRGPAPSAAPGIG